VVYGRIQGDTLRQVVSVKNTQEYAQGYVFAQGGKAPLIHYTEEI
jgi:hypothetical protein